MAEKIHPGIKTPEKQRAISSSRSNNKTCSRSIRSPADRILYLQRTMGNRAVSRLIRSGTLQAKLKFSGNTYEQKPNKVVHTVRGMPGSEAKSLRTPGVMGVIPELNPDLESHVQSFKGGGQSLSKNTLTFFAPRFNHSFDHVKIHTGSQAARVAQSVHARAFTVGQDIVFGAGHYAPATHAGKKLLAHELTHVVQQTKIQGVQSMNGILQKADDGCTPAAGIPNTDCGAYAANSWWLPLAYVNNTTCACKTTPNVPTANCVRKFLQDRLATTPRWLKVMALSHKPLENPATYAQYQAFVQMFLTPRFYRDHVDAYRNCCCPSGPAPYPAWIGVSSVPLPCSAVGASIRYFGSCHGTPGRW
ncbi:MAG: DUF4157 domain-containing protein [ANME-2 cluster archaeon]|nr:DUF4157 domain-containing protein [ANME-2 cluster archaeon]